jgi:hypothetical protein
MLILDSMPIIAKRSNYDRSATQRQTLSNSLIGADHAGWFFLSTTQFPKRFFSR